MQSCFLCTEVGLAVLGVRCLNCYVRYDDGEENTYYDDLKAQMTEQARVSEY